MCPFFPKRWLSVRFDVKRRRSVPRECDGRMLYKKKICRATICDGSIDIYDCNFICLVDPATRIRLSLAWAPVNSHKQGLCCPLWSRMYNLSGVGSLSFFSVGQSGWFCSRSILFSFARETSMYYNKYVVFRFIITNLDRFFFNVDRAKILHWWSNNLHNGSNCFSCTEQNSFVLITISHVRLEHVRRYTKK